MLCLHMFFLLTIKWMEFLKWSLKRYSSAGKIFVKQRYYSFPFIDFTFYLPSGVVRYCATIYKKTIFFYIVFPTEYHFRRSFGPFGTSKNSISCILKVVFVHFDTIGTISIHSKKGKLDTNQTFSLSRIHNLTRKTLRTLFLPTANGRRLSQELWQPSQWTPLVMK